MKINFRAKITQNSFFQTDFADTTITAFTVLKQLFTFEHHSLSSAPSPTAPASTGASSTRASYRSQLVPMWWFLRIIASAIFLLSITLSIPVAFDVGGKDSGLAYSLALCSFYFVYSAIAVVTPVESRVRWAISVILRLSQWIVIPGLLIWALGRFAVDAGATNWVERTLRGITHSKSTSWGEWVFGEGGVVEIITLGGWDNTLRYSSPVFQLLEGFCTLLVIQAAGQITKWLVNRGRSDTWIIILLAFSGSILASAVYFLWRVAHFPYIDNSDAILIGVAMTTAFFLCAYGIGSGRGNPVESSLLFAYVVLCVYQIFTDYQSTETHEAENQSSQPDFPPLPPIIMASYSTLLHMLGSLPHAVHSSLSLLYAAFQTITPSVIISLTFRLLVFYCATRIIPAVRESGARALMEEPSLEDTDAANWLVGIITYFSPSILIAMYTSLLLQHFSTSDGPDGWTLRGGDPGGNVWRWTNVVATMALYAVELYLGNEDHDGGLSNHWKLD
ncbi:Uncharacterized protein Cob_v011315 [Colletotrichum orbiculare MAFF 240422]|uniref:ER membrane protein n=1 Tax=Colletotrichum orbiculare (strain 104-T / ATCC 96160 / CBS 514.97 / LARS 414 / MAFF 240422) TaxID=1213857 RepID=A0A484FEL0_COLOR|nr:Uncharacterized protein Cob_v011315 [Colletotrichum orbiculare MAFF 240422]